MLVWHRCGHPLVERFAVDSWGVMHYWLDAAPDPRHPGRRLRTCPQCGWLLRSRDMRFSAPEKARKAGVGPQGA